MIIRNKKKHTTGIITDGQIRRLNSKNINFNLLKVKKVMTKNPIKIEKNTLATKALSIMNENKITCLCVYDKKKKSNAEEMQLQWIEIDKAKSIAQQTIQRHCRWKCPGLLHEETWN